MLDALARESDHLDEIVQMIYIDDLRENLPCTCRSETFINEVTQCFSTSCDAADQETGDGILTALCLVCS